MSYTYRVRQMRPPTSHLPPDTYCVRQMRPPTIHLRHSWVRGVVGGANPLF